MVFPTQMVMLQLVPYVAEKGLVIKAFYEDGNLVMKKNHPLAIYGGIFVIVMNAKKNQLMMMIN